MADNNENQNGHWITVAGKHIFMKDGESQDEAYDRTFGIVNNKSGSERMDARIKQMAKRNSETMANRLLEKFGSDEYELFDLESVKLQQILESYYEKWGGRGVGHKFYIDDRATLYIDDKPVASLYKGNPDNFKLHKNN